MKTFTEGMLSLGIATVSQKFCPASNDIWDYELRVTQCFRQGYVPTFSSRDSWIKSLSQSTSRRGDSIEFVARLRDDIASDRQ